MTTAMLGGEVTVPTLDGGEERSTVPAGTQHGDVAVLEGHGLPPLRGGERGDQHVVFELVVPTDLSDEQRELVEGLDAELGVQARRVVRGGGLECSPVICDPPRGPLRARVGRDGPGQPARARPERRRGGARAGLGRVRDLRRRRARSPSSGELKAAAGGALVDVTTTSVPDDWADRWADFHRPIEVGGRIGVRPSWWDAKDGLIDVVVDPGRAFGTGGHPTTRLSLALLLVLEESGEASGPLADWGTGSGVLAIAAAKLGWAPDHRLRPRARLARGRRGQRRGQRRRARDRARRRPRGPPLRSPRPWSPT